jgi:hypothetical protein
MRRGAVQGRYRNLLTSACGTSCSARVGSCPKRLAVARSYRLRKAAAQDSSVRSHTWQRGASRNTIEPPLITPLVGEPSVTSVLPTIRPECQIPSPLVFLFRPSR